MSLPPIWSEGPSKVHDVGGVRFQCTRIDPVVESQQLERYPLVIWFCGLGPSGLDGIGVELSWLSRATSKPFVLVAPIRSSGTWWVLNNSQLPLGCVFGSLLECEVEKYCHWIQILAGSSGIDPNSVSLFGGSAGAYAVSEVMASGTCKLHCVGLAALHGHGRPDGVGLSALCRDRLEEIKFKWFAYINRIREHKSSPNILIGVHTVEDSFCPWRYAEFIYSTLECVRQVRDLPSIKIFMVDPSRIRTQSVELFLQLAFGDDEESHSSFCQRTSLPVSGRPAVWSQGDVRFVSSPGQGVGRLRSRSPRASHYGSLEGVNMNGGNVAMVQRCPVVQDGVLPNDHIGCIKLDCGTQLLCIAYSDTAAEVLWAYALNIGHSPCISDLVYFDCEDESALCYRVRSALPTLGAAFEGHHFMYSEVGDFVAVGIGSNMRNRKRSSRVAAAVCFELQAKSAVEEFQHYAGFRSLMKQVTSCINLHVS